MRFTKILLCVPIMAAAIVSSLAQAQAAQPSAAQHSDTIVTRAAAPVYPGIATIQARIWARVMDPAERITPDMDKDDSAANLWDVFEPGGRYLGRVRTGPGTLPSHVKGDKALTYSRDADDVQRVVVARIQWGR